MKKSQLLIWMLFALSLPTMADDVYEQESNNSWTEANRVGINTTIHGTLDANDREDWFCIEVPEEGSVTFTTLSELKLRLNHLYMYAVTDSGELSMIYDVDMDHYSNAQEKKGTRESLKAGTYYVRQDYYTGEGGGYTLRADFTPCSHANDREPNDSYENAADLALGKTVQGRLGYEYCNDKDTKDWYRITLPEEGSVTFTTLSELKLRLNHLYMYAVTDSGELSVIYDVDMDHYSNAQEKKGTRESLKAGTYYVRQDYYTGEGGGYTLRADFTPCSHANDREPNDSYENAADLALGKTVQGRLGYEYCNDKDTQDWYRITLPEEGSVTFTTLSGLKLRLNHLHMYAVTDSGELSEIYDVDMDHYSNAQEKKGTRESLKAGTYYVRQDYYTGEGGGYTLRADFTPCSHANDEEPNDSYENAQSLTFGHTLKGRLGYEYCNDKDTEDWYELVLPADGSVVFSTKSETSMRLGHLKVYHINSEGNIVETAGKDMDAYSKDTTIVFNVDNISAGTHYVCVHYYNGIGAGYTLRADYKPNPFYRTNTLYTRENPCILQENVASYTTLGYEHSDERRTSAWYQLNAPAGGTRIEIQPDTTLTLSLGVVTVYKVDNDGELRYVCSERLERSYGSLSVEEEGTYLVDVPVYRGFGGLVVKYGYGIFADTKTELPVRISMEGRKTVRKGVPSDYTVKVRNISNKRTDEFVVGLTPSPSISIISVTPINTITGQYDETVMFEDMCTVDSSAVFYVPYLDPYEELRFIVRAEGVGDINYAKRRAGDYTYQDFFVEQALDVKDFLTNSVSDFVKGKAIDFIADKIIETIKEDNPINQEELRRYCRDRNITEEQFYNKKEYGQGMRSFRKISESVAGDLMQNIPVADLAMKIGKYTSKIITELGPNLRFNLMKKSRWTATSRTDEEWLDLIDEEVSLSGVVASWDPNEMVGPAGSGEEHYISSGDMDALNYIIMFENKAEAGDAAYRVRISDELDENVFDVNTVTFGNTSHEGYNYNWKMKRDGNKLTWDIEGIELPPNKVAPEGEGYVTFSVKLKPGLVDGTKVSNKATIIFDKNTPIETNVYTNTIDNTSPVTEMGKAYFDSDTTAVVTCDPSDTGSGVHEVRLYGSKNGSEWEYFGVFYGPKMKIDINRSELDDYRFYAIATDGAGNQERQAPATISLDYTYDAISTPSAASASDATYDLIGRKRSEGQLPKGIYIVGGKKVIK